MNLSRKKKIMLAVGIVVFLAVVCGFVAVMAIGGNREGNAQEQLSLGERYLAEMDYERAVAAFEMAIELEPRNIDAYIGLARAYDGLGDTDLALETLETAREKIQELVREGEALPDSAAEVYLMLVRMYEGTGNYEEARFLLEEALSVTDSAELQEIWEAYMPEVEFSLAAGEYEEGTELTLTTEGQAVYYTLDGSDLVQEGEGTAEVVIVLQEGNWTIRAAAEGRGGTLGDVTEVEYVVAAAESMEETEETEPESVESTEEETEPESESTEVMEETEPESIESTEEETEPESESVEVTEETEPEKVTEETATIRIRFMEHLVYDIRVPADISLNELSLEEIEEMYYGSWVRNAFTYLTGTSYPMTNRNISGTIVVHEYNTNNTIIEKEFDLQDVKYDEWIEIEAPYRDQYTVSILAEGYFDFSTSGPVLKYSDSYTYSEYYVCDISFYLIPMNVDNIVEIKFLDKSGNLIYPEVYEFFYKDTEGRFSGEWGKYFNYRSDSEEKWCIRCADGITVGIKLHGMIPDYISGDRIYPIIPDQNGVAYIELSDFDIENIPYQY